MPIDPTEQDPVLTDTSAETDFQTSKAAAAYDAWFRAKVTAAMASTKPTIPHDEVIAQVQRNFDARVSPPNSLQ